MTYFVADIHGEYELFLRLLDLIKFSPSDELIVLGDMIDKGEQSVRLVDFIAELDNARVIIGNHEYDFLKRYDGVMRDFNGSNFNDNAALTALSNGFSQYDKPLSWETVDFIDGLPAYIERENYICVHAGVELDQNGVIMPLKSTLEQLLVYDRRFKEDNCIVESNQKTVLFGHTPCSYVNDTGAFVKTAKRGVLNPNKLTDYSKIRLDCGVYITGMLGALRLEDMREFYVRKQT